ncbi:hypothetical protein K402DRAFT_426162 [Aulographum hederae CBS 113979]|uniref:F-box domain-containing protein n=1 Tax=Aulographum hederae CBS 113979 TaxID=1176131 RepID=A0A6G1GI80_9PEZI|nr:hypothetical protein K402DRAFT_426162 [Aulographum hederae CBS 113979]
MLVIFSRIAHRKKSSTEPCPSREQALLILELLILIFDPLPMKDLIRLKQVSRLFNEVIDLHFQAALFLRDVDTRRYIAPTEDDVIKHYHVEIPDYPVPVANRPWNHGGLEFEPLTVEKYEVQ